MYKLDEVNGEVSVVINLEDKNKNKYYSCWYFELHEFDYMYELKFENKLSNDEILALVKEHAILHAKQLIASNSVDNIDMIVQSENDEIVDYRKLELEWKGVDKNFFEVTYINYENIEYICD